jgi:predicted transposase/invertase (TIGR01784 family)
MTITHISEKLQTATGKIDYQMTNDYMFHAALQKNPKVLKSLICSLLRLRLQEIRSIQIINPIILGETVDEKTFILDINIVLNDNTLINLEMQVENLYNWEERSLSYLCRTFDQLQKGEEYSSAKPVIHISFLDFTPFPEYPEFYASYQFMNEKNHHIYSDKLTLRVVDLRQIELATAEDQASGLEHWARLFKASTWEEIRMIAKKDENLLEATETLYTLNADELVRRQCDARADYYRLHNSINRRMEELLLEKENAVEENKKLNSEVETLNFEVRNLSIENDSLKTENNEKDLLIKHLKAQLKGKE